MTSQKLITLVTGGNQGLGYYAVQQLSATGRHHVLMGSRDLTKAERAITEMEQDASWPSDTSSIEPIEIDVLSDESIKSAAAKVQEKFGRLDVLLSNAGISRAIGVHSDLEPNKDGSGPPLREQWKQLFDTNLFGAAVLIDEFVPLLRKSTLPEGKRIVFTGSTTASLKFASEANDDLNGKIHRIYRSTKTALNMLMVSCMRELEDEGFIVCCADPGFCATNLNSFRGVKDPRDGAVVMVSAALAPKAEVHGKNYSLHVGIVPW